MTDSTQQQPAPTIPSAAVEAAARGMCGTHPLSQWEHKSQAERDLLLAKAKQALEGAAPYMCVHLIARIAELEDALEDAEARLREELM